MSTYVCVCGLGMTVLSRPRNHQQGLSEVPAPDFSTPSTIITYRVSGEVLKNTMKQVIEGIIRNEIEARVDWPSHSQTDLSVRPEPWQGIQTCRYPLPSCCLDLGAHSLSLNPPHLRSLFQGGTADCRPEVPVLKCKYIHVRDHRAFVFVL